MSAMKSPEPFDTAAVVQVTPAMATRWLEKNGANRKIRTKRVRQYMDDMMAGRWVLTPQPIAFNCDGTLIDGQHRLKAIIEAGKPQRFLVVHNVPREAGAVIDQGLTRSVPDAAMFRNINGVNASDVGVAKAMYFGAGSVRSGVSTSQILEFIDKHADALDFVRSAFGKAKLAGVTIAPVKAVIGRAYYTANRDEVRRFVSILTGESEPKSASDHNARKLFMMLYGSRMYGADAREEVYRKTQRALWGFLKGEALKKLYAAPEDMFPIPE